MPQPVVTSFALGDFQTNCHIVRVGDSPRCWVVDCGYEPGPLLEALTEQNLQPQALLLTHCHSDHIAGIDQLLSRTGPLPIYAHEAERGWCSEPLLNLSAALGIPVKVTEPDHFLSGAETLELDGTVWRVVHAPGHSPGSVLFIHDESNQTIAGDTLFAGSIGRSDFPTSDIEDLRRTIDWMIRELPKETRIYPGHGPATTIAAEARSNPFVLHGF